MRDSDYMDQFAALVITEINACFSGLVFLELVSYSRVRGLDNMSGKTGPTPGLPREARTGHKAFSTSRLTPAQRVLGRQRNGEPDLS